MITLMLNNSDEPIGFIKELRLFKLMYCNKIDIVDTWKDIKLRWINSVINMPSVVRMKYYTRYIPIKNASYNRKAVYIRDSYSCQYCGEYLSEKQLTIDHIYPRVLGGENSFLNCVVCCVNCNSKKGGKTLEQSGMKLLSKPYVPTRSKLYRDVPDHGWHPSWKKYL